MANNKIIGKEIHLRKRPVGFVTEDDFELVDVEIPEIKKEGEFLVRNIWISIDRAYLVIHHISCHLQYLIALF